MYPASNPTPQPPSRPNTSTSNAASPKATPPEVSPIAQAVAAILGQAHKSRATDIHIEPRDTLVQIRFRIDGTLRDAMTLPRQMAPAVMSHIKLMSRLKVDEYVVPQNGRLKFAQGGDIVEARVSVLPVVGGEKIVIRILDDATKIRPLAELGLSQPTLSTLHRRLKEGQGMIIVTGPTGSGKTTTLYSALADTNTKSTNISTIEDPVEYSLPGINQTQVDTRTGMTFANCLRAVMRQDPDVIMLGELRDNETANLAMQATMSGHVVFAGLYTKNAAAALPRLLNMGIEPYLVATSVKAIVAQRLVRRLCPQCREVYTATTADLARINQSFPTHRAIEAFHALKTTGSLPDHMPSVAEVQPSTSDTPTGESRKVIPVPASLSEDRGGILERIAEDPKLVDRPDLQPETSTTAQNENRFQAVTDTAYSPSDLQFYRAKGCQKCGNSGYFGRLGVFEALDVSDSMRRLIVESATADNIQTQAENEGMMSMQEDGLIKALQGLTTLDEIIPLADV